MAPAPSVDMPARLDEIRSRLKHHAMRARIKLLCKLKRGFRAPIGTIGRLPERDMQALLLFYRNDTKGDQ